MSNLTLQITLNALGNARQRFDEIANAGTHLNRQLRDLQNQSRELTAAQRQIEQFAQSRQNLGQLNAELQNTQNQIRQLTQEIARSGAPTRTQSQRLQELETRARSLSQQQQQARQTSQNLRQALEAQGLSTSRLSQTQAELRRRHEQTSTAIEQQRRRIERLNQAQDRYARAQANASSLRSAAGSAAMGGTATLAAMVVPISAYAQSEDASTQLRMAMMDASGKVPPEYQKLDALATSLGDRLPGTTADFKNLMTMLMRQGSSAQAVLGGTGEAAALLAVQLKKPPEEAAEMAAKLQDALRANESEMINLMDTVQRLFYAGVDSDSIIPAFGKLAPALDIMKISGVDAMKQLAPLIGMLDQAGLSGEAAGNALRKVFQSVMDTGKVNKAMKGTGIDLNFTDGKGEFAGMEHAYKELAKLQKLNTEQRLLVIKEIWGDDAETIQALNTMIEKGQAGYDEFAANMAAQASLNQRVNEQLGTLANLWDAATGSFTNFMASMGEAIAPELKSITTSISDINGKLSAWSATNPKLAATIMKTIAVIGILLISFAAIATVVASLLGPFALARLAFVQWLPLLSKVVPLLGLLKTGFLLLGKAILANPIVLAIAIIVGGLYLLWRNWETVKNALIQGWNWINQVFANNPILNFLLPVIGLARLLINNWSIIAPFMQTLWTQITTFITTHVTILKVIISSAWNAIYTATASLWNSIKSMVMNAWSSMVNWIRSLSAYQIIVSQWNSIIGFLGGLVGTMTNLGANIIQGLINGIQSRLGGLRSMWQSATSVFNGSAVKPNATAKVPGFSSGGYTGNGGKYEVAGIVHKGEGVLNQQEIQKIGGPSGFARLRQMIGIMGGGAMRGLNRLNESKSQPKPHFAEAVSVGNAMMMAGGGSVQAAGMGNVNITIHINGGNQAPQDIGNEIERRLKNFFADMQRKAKTSFRDQD